MSPQSQRPWFRLHWLTLIVLSWLIGAIADCQLQKQSCDLYGDYEKWDTAFVCGWPFRHLLVRDFNPNRDSVLRLFSLAPTDRHQWYGWALAINGVVWLMLVCCTAWVIERWMRFPKWLQFGSRSLLAFTGVAAVLAAILTQPTPYWVLRLSIEPSFEVEWCNIRKPLRLIIPMGIGCATYFWGWLIVSAAIAGWALIFRRHPKLEPGSTPA